MAARLSILMLMTPFWSTAPFHAVTPWQNIPGSLTARLKACGLFHVRVLQAGMKPAALDEARLLRVPAGRLVYARTVCLEVNGVPRVLARSVTRRVSLRRGWQRLRQQGSRPLGEMLWRKPRIVRAPPSFATLDKRHTMYKALLHHWPRLPAQVPARRACFYLRQQPLLVMEVFLPTIEELPCR